MKQLYSPQNINISIYRNTKHFLESCFTLSLKNANMSIVFFNDCSQIMYSDVAVIIPSRLKSSRLPEKALLKIGKKSMIEHVIISLRNNAITNLYVATDSEQIAQKASNNGAIAIMTNKNCLTGSDRVYEAYNKIRDNNPKIKYVINVQGDLPFIKSTVITQIIDKLKNSNFDIVTPVVKVSKDRVNDSSNVTVVVDKQDRALFFSRNTIPYGAKELLYHIGIYGYQIDALKKFVSLPKTQYESDEKLEQLRALEHGMNVGIVLSDEVPLSVDTKEDLQQARKYYAMINSPKKQ